MGKKKITLILNIRETYNLVNNQDINNVQLRFESWGNNQPSGNGECMGYSENHDLQWDDFQCESYVSSGLTVGFMCEQMIYTTQGETIFHCLK